MLFPFPPVEFFGYSTFTLSRACYTRFIQQVEARLSTMITFQANDREQRAFEIACVEQGLEPGWELAVITALEGDHFHIRQVGDRNPFGELVHIRVTGKGNKERRVRISAQLHGFIRGTFTGEQYLFETANGRPYHTNYVSNQIAVITRRALGEPSGHIRYAIRSLLAKLRKV